MDTYEIVATYETKTTIGELTERPEGYVGGTWCGYAGDVGTLTAVFHVDAHCEGCADVLGYNLIAACAEQVNGKVTAIHPPERLASREVMVDA